MKESGDGKSVNRLPRPGLWMNQFIGNILFDAGLAKKKQHILIWKNDFLKSSKMTNFSYEYFHLFFKGLQNPQLENL